MTGMSTPWKTNARRQRENRKLIQTYIEREEIGEISYVCMYVYSNKNKKKKKCILCGIVKNGPRENLPR